MSKNRLFAFADKFQFRTLFIFAIIFAVAGATLAYTSFAAPPSSKGGHTSSPSVNLSLQPSSQKVSASGTLSVAVWENSLDQPVNAVQANLTYDAAKFDFVSIDGTNSPFEVQAQSTGGTGTIAIARGHVGSVTGSQFVATIILKPKVSGGKTNVNFAAGSEIIRSTDNVNILQQTSPGHYSFGQ